MLKEALHYFIKIALKTTLRIYHVFPVRENRITLLNDMSYTYGDSMKYLYLYMKKNEKIGMRSSIRSSLFREKDRRA